MAIILDCPHILGILFPVKHLLSIVCNHLLTFGPFSRSTSTPSLPAVLLFFCATLPFLYSSSLKGCLIVWIIWIIGRVGFVGIVPWPLMSNWCCCLPTPMTLASGGSPMFPHVVHQPASPSIWPAVQSLRRGLSTNPGVTMWCVCGCS